MHFQGKILLIAQIARVHIKTFDCRLYWPIWVEKRDITRLTGEKFDLIAVLKKQLRLKSWWFFVGGIRCSGNRSRVSMCRHSLQRHFLPHRPLALRRSHRNSKSHKPQHWLDESVQRRGDCFLMGSRINQEGPANWGHSSILSCPLMCLMNVDQQGVWERETGKESSTYWGSLKDWFPVTAAWMVENKKEKQ